MGEEESESGREGKEERERAHMVPGPHLSRGHGVVASH